MDHKETFHQENIERINNITAGKSFQGAVADLQGNFPNMRITSSKSLHMVRLYSEAGVLRVVLDRKTMRVTDIWGDEE